MTQDILARANALQEKIHKLEVYLECYAKPMSSQKKIKIITRTGILQASNWYASHEYELDQEEYALVNEALQKQLQLYKDEFDSLKFE